LRLRRRLLPLLPHRLVAVSAASHRRVSADEAAR
jgi:hypothetical protein